MTDAATLLPLPPPDPGARAAGSGLRPLEGPARGPGTGPAPAGDSGASDPFAAVLQGFLGAALTPPAAPPAPPPTATASLGGDAPTPAPAPAPALPDATLPPPPATAGGKPLPATAGSGLPGAVPGPAAPPPDATGVPPDAATAATVTAGTTSDSDYRLAATGGGDRATSRGQSGAPAAPATSEAAALLADLDRSRTALAPAARPLAAGPAGRARAGELPDTTIATTTPATATADASLGTALADLTGTAGATLAPASTGGAATGSATATAGSPVRGDAPAASTGSGAGLAPLGDPASFASGLGERLLDLGRDGTQSARLRLHPESLGPLDVRIQVEDGEARVWFNTAHGQTRDAIEASLPRLRELFAGQGIELGRVQVDVRSDGGAPPAWQAPAGDAGTGGGGRTPPDGRDAPVARRADPWGGSERAETTARAPSRRLDVLA